MLWRAAAWGHAILSGAPESNKAAPVCPCAFFRGKAGRKAVLPEYPGGLHIDRGPVCRWHTGPAVAHDRIFVIGLGAFGAVRQANPNHCTLMGGTPP